MAASSRSTQYNQLHKTLKKLYKPVSPPPERPVLEHLLFACCLENAHYPVAEEAFATLIHSFFDLNEIRVSSVRELSEVLHRLPEPAAAALRVKRVLQNVFEASYSFDLEDLRKLNLGPAVERLEKITGTSKFTVAYVVQAALGGHSIPADEGTLKALWTVEILTEEEAAAGTLPGVERAIPKNRGSEFGSLLHQLGADFAANPYSPQFHQTLLQINPDIKDRLPKRRAVKAEPPAPAPAPRKRGSAKAAPQEAASAASSSEPAEEAPPKAKKAVPGKTVPRKRKAEAEPATNEPPAAESEASAKKKPASTKKKEPAKRASEAKPKASAENPVKEAASAGLAKRKPR